MNRWFQDLPIRRKLRLLIVATGSIALVLASVTLLILKSMDLSKETLTEISTLAEVIGANTTAALLSGSPGRRRDAVGPAGG